VAHVALNGGGYSLALGEVHTDPLCAFEFDTSTIHNGFRFVSIGGPPYGDPVVFDGSVAAATNTQTIHNRALNKGDSVLILDDDQHQQWTKVITDYVQTVRTPGTTKGLMGISTTSLPIHSVRQSRI
jgi:hypothetical protein